MNAGIALTCGNVLFRLKMPVLIARGNANTLLHCCCMVLKFHFLNLKNVLKFAVNAHQCVRNMTIPPATNVEIFAGNVRKRVT
jgi:hypothetical protein